MNQDLSEVYCPRNLQQVYGKKMHAIKLPMSKNFYAAKQIYI